MSCWLNALVSAMLCQWRSRKSATSLSEITFAAIILTDAINHGAVAARARSGGGCASGNDLKMADRYRVWLLAPFPKHEDNVIAASMVPHNLAGAIRLQRPLLARFVLADLCPDWKVAAIIHD